MHRSKAHPRPHDELGIEALRFLDRVTRAVSSARDQEAMLREVAGLLVPERAEWVEIYLVSDAGLDRVTVRHANARREFDMQTQLRDIPPMLDRPRGVSSVIRSGVPELLSEIDAQALQELTFSAAHVTLLVGLGIHAQLTVPIVAEDRILGAIALGATAASPAFTQQDVEVLRQIGIRAGFSLAHMQLLESEKLLRLERDRLASELMEAERSATRANEEARDIVESVTDVLVRFDNDLRYTYFNRKAEALFGKPSSEVLGKTIHEAFPEITTSASGKMIQKAQELQEPVNYEYYLSSSGQWYDTYVYPTKRGLTVYSHEITERKKLESAMAGSEQRFRDLVDLSPLSTQVLGADGKLVQANPAWEDLWGVKMEDLAEWSFHDDPQLKERGIYRQIMRAFAGETVNVPPVPFAPPFGAYAGEERWVRATIYPVQKSAQGYGEVVIIQEDITEQYRSQKALREANERFKLAASVVNGVIYDHDHVTGLVERTEALHSLLGFTPDEVPPKSTWWQSRMHPADREDLAVRYIKTIEEHLPYDFEYRMLHRLGHYITVWDRGVVEYGEGGQPIRTVGIVIDVSEARRAQAELKRAKEAAEAASQAKDSFISVLSHELRTPLTPVLATVEDLENEARLPEWMLEPIGLIKRNIQLESHLINDLLDVTRIERGKLSISKHVVDVHQLLEDLAASHQSQIERKRLKLTLGLAAREHTIGGDQARIMQIFTNLLSNAIKFTPEGGEIAIESASSHSHVTIAIRDTGIGIESHLLRTIFSPFEQGEAQISKRYGGLGLGLAIARNLVELHEGTIRATSAGMDRGATLTVELPLYLVAAETNSKKTPRRAAPSTSPKQTQLQPRKGRILLVDDHADTNRAVMAILSRRGYEVMTADTMRSGIELALRQEFDILVSDIGLPDGSGIELLKEVRQHKDVKAIAVSGYGTHEDIQRSKEAGFLAHITKPFNFPDLQDKLDTILGLKQP